MRSTRGMFGKQVVFKTRAGKPYVAAPPEVDENRVPTAGQVANNDKFRRNSRYAKAAIADAGTKAGYLAAAKRGQSAYNVAFQDAAYAPKVDGIITQGYRGQAGDIIVVQASDDFKVAAVKVAIESPTGELLEHGNAVLEPNGLNWVFTPTMENEQATGSKITATAYDLPGNEGSLEATV